MPMFRPTGFRGRLLVAMLALALVTSLVIAAAFMVSTFRDEENRARERLQVASGVIREILARRNQLLVNTLNVLVDDFGFRSAIASGDQATLSSALDNHSQRFRADLAMLADRDGNVINSLQTLAPGKRVPFPALLDEANRRGAAASLVIWDEQAFQALMVPVQAPGLKAWLVMGYSLDNRFAREISELTGVDVVFESRESPPRAFGHSMVQRNPASIMAAVRDSGEQASMSGDHRYFSQTTRLNADDSAPVRARLLLDRQTALANYYRLAWNLTLLVAVCLGVACLLALALARALGKPVLHLARYADDLGDDLTAVPPPLTVRDELGRLAQALFAMSRRIRHREHRIHHDASHDSLTGLPNRLALDRHLRRQLESGRPGYLLSLSIVGLKELSETLGYDFGDRVIIATGLRLRGALDHRCPLGRTGGNEFMTFLPGRDRERLEAELAQLRQVAEETILISGTPASVSLCAAILHLPDQAASLDDIRRRVSLTMDRARYGETRSAFYAVGGDELHLRELAIIRDLHTAMENNQLTMVYQPKVRFQDGTVAAVEALVRWTHPQLGPLNPEEFIALAERSGQIHTLTEHILRRIRRDAGQWQEAGLRELGIAVNLSALDLNNPRLPDLVDGVFADWPRPLNTLTFEITESAAMVDTQAAMRALARLRELGVRLSVDDFGTGYSSLAQMRQLPVQELKIDKSFVLRLDATPQDQLIVRSTIDMAHGLGLGVVAEGVENEASWHLLRHWGCELAQGYLISRPLPASELAGWHAAFREQAAQLTQDRPRRAVTDRSQS